MRDRQVCQSIFLEEPRTWLSTSRTFLWLIIHTNKFIEQQNQKWGIDKYAKAYFWRKRESELSTSRTFVWLITLDYKRARQSRQESVRFQSALCEVASEPKKGQVWRSPLWAGQRIAGWEEFWKISYCYSCCCISWKQWDT